MINELINRMRTKLNDNFEIEETKTILNILYTELIDFNVELKTTEIVPYQFEEKYIQYYIASLKIEGLSKRTLELYNNRIRIFLNYMQLRIEEITTNHIRIFLYKYQEEKNVQNCTIEQFRIIIGCFTKWCHMEGYIKTDPSHNINKIKCELKLQPVLTPLQIERFKKYANDKREIALIETLYSTGVRVSELINIKINEIDFDSNTILITNGKGNKHRNVYFNSRCHVAIQDYISSRKQKSEYLFAAYRSPYNKLTKNMVERIFMSLSEKSNIKCTPHTLRRSMATNSGLQLQEVSKILGHSNTAITERYKQLSETSLRNAYMASNF